MTAVDWTLIGEIQPASDWLLTSPTEGNAFRFEHHNPPRRALLQVAQTDGTDWLFEPRVLSSDRGSQLLLMDNQAVFAAARRLGVRHADANTVVNNWTVRIYAATISTAEDAALVEIAAVSSQLTSVQQSQVAAQQAIANQMAALAANQTQMDASLSAILAILSPPAPTPAPTPKASTTPYVASYSSAFGGYEPTYAKLTDGNYSNGSLTNYGNSWIKATFPAPILVTGISVGGGHDPNNGDLRLTGIQVQYSTNDADWVTLTTITGNYSTGNVVFTYQVDPAITAQYWRLYKAADYVWVSEFTFQP